MDDTVSYHFATVKQRRDNRHEIDFQLTFRQQPKQSRMCGVGEKADRRPIDPPPIVQLRVIDPSLPPLEANTYLQNPYYFMYASLMAADLDEEVHLLRDGKTRSTTGSVVSSLYHLKDTNNTDAGFFVFPDLSVRMEGKYCLKLSLFEIIGKEVFHCKSIISDQFIVYSAKKFPGMEESTFLSRSFADQGLKIRIRKELRQRRKTGKRQESDDDSPHMQTRLIDKRPRPYDQIQHQHQSDSIVPTPMSTATSAPSLTASSTALDFRVPPPNSAQTMYSVHSSYGDRPSTFFDPNDVELHWAGSSVQQQQQQPQSQPSSQSQQQQHQHQHQHQQRTWPISPTAVSPGNPYYINTSLADHGRRYPQQESYSDSFNQPNSIRHYTSPPPPLLSTPSYSSQSPLQYTQQQQSSYSSYQLQSQSSRPPDPFGQQQQQQYTESAMHHLRVDQSNSFSKRP